MSPASIFLARDYERAEAQILHVIELAPDRVVARVLLGQIQMMLDRHESAISMLEALHQAPAVEAAVAWGHAGVGPALAWAYAVAGKESKAHALLQELEHQDDGKAAFVRLMAIAYGALDDRDSAFRWLDAACERRGLGVSNLNVDPLLDGLRSDERFDALLRRIHLPSGA